MIPLMIHGVHMSGIPFKGKPLSKKPAAKSLNNSDPLKIILNGLYSCDSSVPIVRAVEKQYLKSE